MSDQINQLIATQARRAFDQGVRTEQQRIITLLKQQITECGEACDYCVAQEDAIALIKGEHK